jgi:hypothetical protein
MRRLYHTRCNETSANPCISSNSIIISIKNTIARRTFANATPISQVDGLIDPDTAPILAACDANGEGPALKELEEQNSKLTKRQDSNAANRSSIGQQI